jgi:glycosyltransferase involved in cell wall biosynthesis
MEKRMTSRPLLTFALITYRQEQFIAEAVHGALSQTYTPLEIILSDDRSPDRTFDILRQIAAEYRGENTVITRQTERNLGLIGHINDIMRIARGELVVIAAGDDISLPERTIRIFEEYLASGCKAHSIFSNAIWIDEQGSRMNPLHKKPVASEELSLTNYVSRRIPSLVNGATHAWKRDIFDVFGPIPSEMRAEDILLPFRSALLGEIRYIYEPLVHYRRDSGRLKDDKGKNSFPLHRQRWLGWQKLHAEMYRARLNDLETFLARGVNTHPPADLEFVRQVTTSRLAELDALLAVNTGQPAPADLPPLQHLKLRAAGFFEPLLDFLRLNAYYRYQNLHRLLKSPIT